VVVVIGQRERVAGLRERHQADDLVRLHRPLELEQAADRALGDRAGVIRGSARTVAAVAVVSAKDGAPNAGAASTAGVQARERRGRGRRRARRRLRPTADGRRAATVGRSAHGDASRPSARP